MTNTKLDTALATVHRFQIDDELSTAVTDFLDFLPKSKQ